MKNHKLRSGAIAIAVMLAVGASTAIAQGAQAWRERTVVPIASGEWTGARLADGQPDVQGHWSNTIGNHNNFTVRKEATTVRRVEGRGSGASARTARRAG